MSLGSFTPTDATSLQSRKYHTSRYTLHKFTGVSSYVILTLACTITGKVFLSFVHDVSADRDANIMHFIAAYIFVGLPINYMLVVLGQYSQLSSQMFKHMCPLGHGIGYTVILISLAWCCFHGIQAANFLLYALACLETELHWLHCPPDTEDTCWDADSTCRVNCLSNTISTASFIYWRHMFLNESSIHQDQFNFQAPALTTIVTLFIVWGVTYLFLCTSIDKFQTVLHFNAIIVVAFVIMLLLVTLLTGGATDGYASLLRMKLVAFFNYGSWSYAISITIENLALTRTCHMVYGTYLSPHMDSEVLVITTVVLNFIIAFVGSLNSQALVGIILRFAGLDSEGIAYVWNDAYVPILTVLPQGLGFLGVPQLWSIVYFLVCLIILLSTIVCQLGTIERGLCDANNRIYPYRKYLRACICVFCYLYGILFCSKGSFGTVLGFYSKIIKTVETLVCLLIAVVAFWIYRVNRLSDDIHFLKGAQPTAFWKILWCLSPIFLLSSLLYRCFLDPENNGPTSSIILIHFTILILPIPLSMVYEIFRYLKTHNLVGIFQPEERWGPPDAEERHMRQLFNPRQEIRSRRRDDTCNHNCLLGNKLLKKIVFEEREARMPAQSAMSQSSESESC